MPVSNFHSNAQRVFYPGFDGVLNLSVPSEVQPKNELKEAVNVEYSHLTGNMRVRGGLVWSGKFDKTVAKVAAISGRNGFLVRLWDTNDALYFRWNNIWPVSGTFSSRTTLSVVAWEDKAGNDCWLIASGKQLQKFTDAPLPAIETITTAPKNCKLVFVRNGRVGVVCGSDTIKFSAVGDCESDSAWTNDPNNVSSAQWIDIGYKDGMDITAVIPLSKDLIIFKNPPGEPDKGIIWRLTGDFGKTVETTTLQVLEVAHNIGTFSQQSVCVVGNDIFFATGAGIATLSTVVNYGEVKTGWPDRKVSNALTPKLDDTCKIYDVPVKQQLWVSPASNSKEIWVLDYGHGIWTTFEFPTKITYAFGVEERLFVFIGQDIYELNDWYSQDNVHDNNGNEKVYDITARMRLAPLMSGMQTLVKRVFASFELMPECRAELLLGKYRMEFKAGATSDYIYDAPNDTQAAYEDDDPLFSDGGVQTSRKQCIVRDWIITPEIKMYVGGCSVSTVGFEIAEV